MPKLVFKPKDRDSIPYFIGVPYGVTDGYKVYDGEVFEEFDMSNLTLYGWLVFCNDQSFFASMPREQYKAYLGLFYYNVLNRPIAYHTLHGICIYDVDKLVGDLRGLTNSGKKVLSETEIASIIYFFSTILNKAKDFGIIYKNPCDDFITEKIIRLATEAYY